MVTIYNEKSVLAAHGFGPRLISSIALEPVVKEGEGRRKPHGSLKAKRETKRPRSQLSLGEHVSNDLVSFPYSPLPQGPITSQ